MQSLADSSVEEKPSAVVLEGFTYHNAILRVSKQICQTFQHCKLMDFNQTLVNCRGSSMRQPREHYEKSDTVQDSLRQKPEPELGHSDIREL